MGDVRTAKLKFSELKFLDDNPRTITREDLERLAGRIKEDPTFFDNRSCLVNFTDGQYLCYAGFQRAHAAAKILKWKEIPCMIENDVPVSVMRKRAILDNTHDGEWNSEVLISWEYEVEEYRDMGVPEWVFGGDGVGLTDDEMNDFFSNDTTNGEQIPTGKIVLEYTLEEVETVKSALLKIEKTPEQAVWKLLNL